MRNKNQYFSTISTIATNGTIACKDRKEYLRRTGEVRLQYKRAQSVEDRLERERALDASLRIEDELEEALSAKQIDARIDELGWEECLEAHRKASYNPIDLGWF